LERNRLGEAGRKRLKAGILVYRAASSTLATSCLQGGDRIGEAITGELWPDKPLLLADVMSLPSADNRRKNRASWLPLNLIFCGFFFVLQIHTNLIQQHFK